MSFEPILDTLSEFGFRLASSIIEIPEIDHGIFIPVHVTRSADGSMNPKKVDFIRAKSRLQILGFSPEFLLINEGTEDAEHSLRASLLISFPEIVRNVFLSVGTANCNVWIDQKRNIDAEERVRINEHVSQFVQLFRLPQASVLSLGDISLPTKFEVLAVIRAKSPINCETLRDVLIERGLTVPSLDWINRQFDALRKSGLVTRRNDRQYVLTLDALQRLGTSKSRRSPDVQRLLALAQGRV